MEIKTLGRLQRPPFVGKINLKKKFYLSLIFENLLPLGFLFRIANSKRTC